MWQDCDEVHGIYDIMNDFSTIAKPGTYLADTLPFLGKLPRNYNGGVRASNLTLTNKPTYGCLSGVHSRLRWRPNRPRNASSSNVSDVAVGNVREACTDILRL